MKTLLITSDDFGMTLSVNQGIEKAMLEGVVAATNLMVPCPWFQDAAQRVKRHGLATGIHLTLTCEWDRYRWPSLTDCKQLKSADGALPRAYAELPDELTSEQIFNEFCAQLSELRRCGIEPTHVDTHMLASQSDSPMELRVKEVVRRLCDKEGLIYTYDTAGDSSESPLIHFASEIHASPISSDELMRQLRGLGEGRHHIICHCAVDGPELGELNSQAQPWAREYRVKDYSLFTSVGFADFLSAEGFQLITVRDLLNDQTTATL